MMRAIFKHDQQGNVVSFCRSDFMYPGCIQVVKFEAREFMDKAIIISYGGPLVLLYL
jgi:hypothetical protein